MKKHSNTRYNQQVYWDVDDIILNTSETLVKLINTHYNIPNNIPIKTIKDLKDKNFKSINKQMNESLISEFKLSPEFWTLVNINKNFLSVTDTINKYTHNIVSTGDMLESIYTKKYLENIFDIEYMYPINTDMSNDIYISCDINNLEKSNAHLKILLTNNLETNYNEFGGYLHPLPDNVYVVNTFDQIVEILEFNSKYRL